MAEVYRRRYVLPMRWWIAALLSAMAASPSVAQEIASAKTVGQLLQQCRAASDPASNCYGYVTGILDTAMIYNISNPGGLTSPKAFCVPSGIPIGAVVSVVVHALTELDRSYYNLPASSIAWGALLELGPADPAEVRSPSRRSTTGRRISPQYARARPMTSQSAAPPANRSEQVLLLAVRPSGSCMHCMQVLLRRSTRCARIILRVGYPPRRPAPVGKILPFVSR
jgi:hypothetical protein